MAKYWVVGAAWDGTNHQDKRFVKEGIWMLGWEDGIQPERASEIQPGDRIAIKRRRVKARKAFASFISESSRGSFVIQAMSSALSTG